MAKAAVVAAALGLIASIVAGAAEHEPFYEPTLTEWFGVGDRLPIKRLGPNVTFEEFERAARRGEPIIVVDATRGLPTVGWTCESVRNQFSSLADQEPGEGRFKIEYASAESLGSEYDIDDHGHITINNGNIDWFSTEAATGEALIGGKGPKHAPLYWGAKGGETSPGSALSELQPYLALPYFLEVAAVERGDGVEEGGEECESIPDAAARRFEIKANLERIKESPEFWFSRAEAGARAHVDPHCDSTMSLQLAGAKRWRLSPPPAVLNVATDTDDKGDGMIHTDTREGEGLFFPSGWIHETTNVGTEEGSAEEQTCALSLTHQWLHPMPTAYLRAFLPRMLLQGNLQHCHGLYGFGPGSGLWDGPLLGSFPWAPRDSGAQQWMQTLDSNHDNRLTAAGDGEKYHNRPASGSINDLIAYHDANNDGVVNATEVAQSAEEYARVSRFGAHSVMQMLKFLTLTKKLRRRCGADGLEVARHLVRLARERWLLRRQGGGGYVGRRAALLAALRPDGELRQEIEGLLRSYVVPSDQDGGGGGGEAEGADGPEALDEACLTAMLGANGYAAVVGDTELPLSNLDVPWAPVIIENAEVLDAAGFGVPNAAREHGLKTLVSALSEAFLEQE